MAEKKKEKDRLEMKKMMLLDIARIREIDPEVAQEVYLIYRELMSQRHELRERKKSERGAWAENIALDTELDALKSERDILQVNLSRLKSMYEEKVRQANQLLLEQRDLLLRQGIAETSYDILLDSLEDMHRRISKRYVEEIPEAIRREMQASISFMVEQVNQVVTSAREIPPIRVAPPPKPATVKAKEIIKEIT